MSDPANDTEKDVLFWNIAITVGFIRIAKLDFDIAVDQKGGTYDQTFEVGPNAE